MKNALHQMDIADGNSVAGRIAQALAARIVSGDLPPGAPVRQDHVAVEFAASHVPVREAFRRLEAQGLLVSLPRRGVRVAPLDPAMVREVTEMRAALEALALRYAAPNLSAADLELAERALAEIESSDRIELWEEANRRFHRLLAAPCGMPRLLSAIDDLQRTAARFLFATWRDLSWQPRSEAEHHAILAALRAGRTAEAEELMRRHILEAGAALRHRLEASGG